jgi:hypothetical protein
MKLVYVQLVRIGCQTKLSTVRAELPAAGRNLSVKTNGGRGSITSETPIRHSLNEHFLW